MPDQWGQPRDDCSCLPALLISENQHSVTEAEEPVLAANGLCVSSTGELKTRERTYQDKQSTTRQVKVRNHAVKPVEGMSGLNEKSSVALEGLEFVSNRCSFQGSSNRCAYRNNSSALASSSLKSSGSKGRKLGPLSVHDMIFDAISLDGTKRTDANVKC